MESLRDVKRQMEREVEKKRAVPLELVDINIDSSESYKDITSFDHYKQVLNWLLRLNEYRTGEATVVNNIYMDMKPLAKKPEFNRAKSILERMNYSLNAIKYVKKKNPSYDGDCVLEEAICRFSLPDEEKERCSYVYDGKDTYAFSMSNKYLLGLFCQCEQARADLGMEQQTKVNLSRNEQIMALTNTKDVLFQALLLDDVWADGADICAKLYTIYTINKEA